MGISIKKSIKPTLQQDKLFKSYKAKFNVLIKRTKDKKITQFPSNWNKTIDNQTSKDSINIAFVTGPINDLSILDFDSEDSKTWFEKNICKLEDAKAHYVKTVNGYHLYFKYTKNLDELLAKYTKSKVKMILSLDLRSVGNCIFYGKGYELKKYERH